MPSNKDEKRSTSVPGHGHGKVMEKPKNFSLAIKKLVTSLKKYKVFIMLAIILASLSAILALSSPSRLSSLTDEIAKGLVINTDGAKELSNDILSNISMENLPNTLKDILEINLDESTIYGINMSSSISKEDKDLFNSVISNIASDNENSMKYFVSLPSSILELILKDTTYNEVFVSKEDKIKLLDVLGNINMDNGDYSFVDLLPDSINSILFQESIVNKVVISTDDKVSFIKIASKIKEDTPQNEIYKLIGTMPSSIQKIINPKMKMTAIKRIVLTLAIIYILSSLFNFVQGRVMVVISNRYAKNLRTIISKKINRLPLKYFDNNLSGDILSRITNDVDTIAQSLNQSLATLVSSLTMFLGSIIMMFVTNYILAITAIVSSVFGFVFMAIVLGKSQKYFTERQKELGDLNGYIEEVYSGLNALKTCNAKEEANKRFDSLNEKLYTYNQKSEFLSGLMHPMMGFIGNFGYVCVCIVGALLASKEIITFGVIVAFIMYVRQFTNPLSQIAQAMTSLQTVAASSERVFEFLDEKEMTSEDNLKEKLDVKKVKGKIEFNHVKFGYDDGKTIIKDFSAIAEPGEKIAIVGPTGAGKTTMVNLLMKFYEINSGDIKIDGVSIKNLKRENIHDLFTMVLQDTWLFEGTIKDNIVYNRKNVSDRKVEEVCRTVGVDHFIKTLPDGYNSVISDNNNISAGQRQLLTIARGMIENAPFLILDEATSNVDTRTEELVQKAMDKLMENKTSFIIAHRLSTIKNADLILVMNDGNIIEQGNHNELMKKNGFYAKLYNSQFESIE